MHLCVFGTDIAGDKRLTYRKVYRRWTQNYQYM